MQTWIVNHFALTPDQPGGTRHIELAKQLATHGIEVTIVGAGQQHISNRNHVPSGHRWFREDVEGVRFHWIATPSASSGYFARIWNNIVFGTSVVCRRGLKDLSKPDVIIGTSPDLISAFSAYLAARFFSVPFVLEIRDIWPLSAVEIGLFSRRHPFILTLSFVERFLYRRADWIVTLLPHAHRHIVPAGGDPEKISWIPNGFTVRGDQSGTQPHCDPPSKVFTLMYAGSHGNANNLESLLEAASVLKQRGTADNLKIRLVGEGPNKPQLQNRATELGLDFVHFESGVPKRAIGDILAEADAFCLVFHSRAIYRHGISANKLFDYLAIGRPVIIALDAEYNPVRDAQAGICIPAEDVQALADAIAKLMAAPHEERARMGERARHYAIENHSMNRLADRFSKVLTQVVQTKRGRESAAEDSLRRRG